jgi:hypothetical protein
MRGALKIFIQAFEQGYRDPEATAPPRVLAPGCRPWPLSPVPYSLSPAMRSPAILPVVRGCLLHVLPVGFSSHKYFALPAACQRARPAFPPIPPFLPHCARRSALPWECLSPDPCAHCMRKKRETPSLASSTACPAVAVSPLLAHLSPLPGRLRRPNGISADTNGKGFPPSSVVDSEGPAAAAARKGVGI